MFAQLLITVVIAWLLAEILCRLVLKISAWHALLSLVGVAEPVPAVIDESTPHADLRRLLIRRREELAAARDRLNLAVRASDMTEELAAVETELAEVEEKLAEIETARSVKRRK